MDAGKELWKPKRRIESMYQNSLNQVMKNLQMRLIGLENPKDIVNEIKRFVDSQYFNDYANATANKMVTHLFTDAGHTWRDAAKENGLGRDVFESLKKELNGHIGGVVNFQVKRNAEIIKRLPLDISRQVTEHILNESLKGKRASDIAEEIKMFFPNTTKARAQLIARTEVSKTSTALTRARANNIGAEWYMWKTSEDSRVRSSHKHMDGVLVKWTNPPSPESLIGKKSVGYYNAGDVFNCRCYPEVVLNLDKLPWPCKVYYGGRIQSMSKSQFKSIM